MDKKSSEQIPEIVVSSRRTTKWVSAAVAKGRLRKIGPRLYTSNLKDADVAIVRRNLWQIVAAYCPGAVVADRTALEGRPSPDGTVFVVADRARDVDLPGLKIRPRRGTGPVEGDRPFVAGLYYSSRARALLENLRPSRARAGVARTLHLAQIEETLERDLVSGGDGAINQIRDQARVIAPALGLEVEMAKLDAIIGTLLGTKAAQMTSPVTAARVRGRPYDPRRLELFQTLHAELVAQAPVMRAARQTSSEAIANLCFFEAYFSNFIEGTEFAVEEARDIVFNNVIPKERPEDAHDIVGTFEVVSNTMEMSRTPTSADAFIETMKRRHATVMRGRPDKRPGETKLTDNRAGSLVFVVPDLVEGTLAQGFDLYQSLETAFARAVFMMFLVSEVHPFVDGNGRVARIMMNAELVAAGEQRILIPTVYRNNYLAALRALSHNSQPEPLVRTLDFAQRYAASIPFDSFEEANEVMARTSAFISSNEAEETGVRLRLPSPDMLEDAAAKFRVGSGTLATGES
jgi:hypothetical protein